MSEMVERVARAIVSAADGTEGVGFDALMADQSGEPIRIYKEELLKVARAAIAAMREPTGLMIAGADDPLDWAGDGWGERATPETVWRAMTDAALKP